MFKTQFPEIDEHIRELHASIKTVLGSRLCGLYLFGSIVGGDFNPKTSDIDLLAIVETTITEQELHALGAMHQDFIERHPEWHDRIEVAYVSAEAMRNFKTTTAPIVRISPGEPLHHRDMDIQWLTDWHMVQEQGITIDGPEPSVFIPTITEQEFIDSITHEYPLWLERAKEARWVGYQSYVILSLSRNLYAIRHGHQASKLKGGAWIAREYPEWADLVRRAVKWHGSSDRSDSPGTQDETIQFAEFMMRKV